MIRVYGAHRFESLRERLLMRLQQPRRSLWTPDTVIVPSAAIRRQLSLDIAQAHGVCAQVEFSFLAQWLWQLMGRHLSGIAAQSALDSSALTWRVYDLLASPDVVRQHPRLAFGLPSDDPLQRFELSAAIAGLFETYATYRPEWLQQWQQLGDRWEEAWTGAQHPDVAWQAALWQALAQRMALAYEHPTDTFVTWLQQAPAGSVRDAQGEELQVHVFALPTIAPQHLRVLHALGRHAHITLYVINPCAHYWLDVVEPRRLANLRLQGRDQHHESAHPLLSAWGQQTQAFLNLLLQTVDDADMQELDLDVAPEHGRSLLRRWQDSILYLQAPLPEDGPWDSTDRSLEVHVCHSWVRELEVLHDRLLGLFSQDATLTPADVLVVVPRWSEAAPWIDAVFGTVDPKRRIPYALTGLSPSSHDEAAQALQMLLQWLPSHWPVSEMLELMRQGPIAQRFGWSDDDLRVIEDWLQAAAVHWGRPPAAQDAPAHAHDLYAGVQRMFLGMALPAQGAAASATPEAPIISTDLWQPAACCWPATAVDSAQSELLGRLWHWVSTMWQAAQQLTQATSAVQWVDLLRSLAHRAMASDTDASPGLRSVHQAIDALNQEWQQAGWIAADGTAVPHAPLTAEVVRQRLSQWWAQDRQGGVPTGSVTFSAMNSLRQLPFRVVCVLGLQDEAFPGVSAPCEFDLMAAHPLPTDRQARLEARNVFLDLLLSARDVVHLSYTGRQIRDNAPLAPSVVISELLEFLGPIQDQVVVHHPLHPFSLAAFDSTAGDPRRLSFHSAYAQALAQAQEGEQTLRHGAQAWPQEDPEDAAPDEPVDDRGDMTSLRDQPAFFTHPLPHRPHVNGDRPTLPLSQWIRFFHHPARYWLTRRVGVQLPYREDLIRDHEPVWPLRGALQGLAERLMPALLAGVPHDQLLRRARCGPQIPPGPLGESWLHTALPRLQRIADRLRPVLDAPRCPPLYTSVCLPLNDGHGLELHHRWSDLRHSGVVSWYADTIRATERLRLWWHHLLLCAQCPQDVQPHTTWIDANGAWQLRPVADARRVLEQAALAWELGQHEPLAFFPRTSWAYVEAGGQADDITPHALKQALEVWRPHQHSAHAEGTDESVRWVWRGRGDPVLDAAQQAAFAHWSGTIMGPLHAHLHALDGDPADLALEGGGDVH